MSCFKITVRRALDRAPRLTTARRAAPALALAATLLTSALGPPTPVGVAAESPEPAARLQVVVKEVKIHDDREGLLFGEGEMLLYVGIWRCNVGTPPPCISSIQIKGGPDNLPASIGGTAGPIARAGMFLNGGTDDTVTLDRQVPQFGDQMWGGNTSQELGFAVYDGEHYVMQFDMAEWDNAEPFGTDEYMGWVFHFIDTGEHGLDLGTHTKRSHADGGRLGDYTITYEIRRTPLPDIRPVNIKVHDLPGSTKKLVCMAVVNSEAFDAGPFEVALRVDGVVPPGGRITAGRLASGDAGDLCVEVALPTSGRHTLAAVVDEPRTLLEYNEANNVYEQPYQR